MCKHLNIVRDEPEEYIYFGGGDVEYLHPGKTDYGYCEDCGLIFEWIGDDWFTPQDVPTSLSPSPWCFDPHR